MRTRLAAVLGSATILGLTLAATVPTIRPVATATYEVAVTGDDGSSFIACFHFGQPTADSLSADGYFTFGTTKFIYRAGGLNDDARSFKAVESNTQSIYSALMMFGKISDRRLSGESLDGLGHTAVFSGTRNDSCVPTVGH